MAHRRSKGNNRRNGGRRRGGGGGSLSRILMILGMVLIPLISLSGGGYLAWRYINTEQMDAALCYPRPTQYQAAVFVDFSLTHQVSDSQRRDLRNTLTQTFNSMPANGKISIFTTESQTTATRSVPVFTLCKPAATVAEQDQIGAPAISAPKLARLKRDASATFSTYVDDMLARSRQNQNLAASSPILEQLQAITRHRFASPLSQLIVYTDGINNSAAGQFCSKQGELPRFSVFAEQGDYLYVQPEDLRGAQVDMLMVEIGSLPSSSLPYCSNAELRAFWTDYFRANGAGKVRLTPLGYGAGK